MKIDEVRHKNAIRETCKANGADIYVRVGSENVAFKDLPYAEQEQWIDKWHTEQLERFREALDGKL